MDQCVAGPDFCPDPAVTVPMSDHHTVKPPRNRADNHSLCRQPLTVQTNPEPQIGILGDSSICKMSVGQQVSSPTIIPNRASSAANSR
ncbi:MAG: hypothetical protein DLM61_17830 [Pseudonocardiales bacterium]|nr:MAG: hypothetical protein DLM61_17830 [Pseudonocardiales bacterium]